MSIFSTGLRIYKLDVLAGCGVMWINEMLSFHKILFHTSGIMN